LLGQPAAAVEADADAKREPGLQTHIAQAQVGVQEVTGC
jgi:hypothetical protein